MKPIAWHRVWAVVLRHLYNFYHSWDRIVDAFYWPSLDIIIWGLTISALTKQGQGAIIQISMVVSGIILWYVLWRGQYEITVNLLEELWSENLGNLFSSPLTLPEWTIALCALGFLKLILTIAFTALVAYFLYAVNIFHLGFALIPFIVGLLIMGWGFGLFIAGLFLRFGTNIQTLAWAGGFALMPFSATYYPLDSLPNWVQAVAHFLPSSYIFEGMRSVLLTGSFQTDMMIKSYLLNAVFLMLALAFFIRSFRLARINGLAHLK
ncbi:MAG: ABC transporter permease [Patescibacteria group bacterium]